jgi:hypothetical protein
MIYCSHCGVQNRDGSKFCNNCGARLTPESGLRCPMCSTPNSVENVFCSNCGARLVPLTAANIPEPKTPAPPIKGLTLPAKPIEPGELPDAAAIEEETRAERPKSVEDWLEHFRATPPPVEETAPEAIEDEDIPDWLKSAPKEPAPPIVKEELPDWLKGKSKEPESPTAALEAELPDWLKQETPESQIRAATVAEEELPDWLKGAAPQPESEEPAREPEEPEIIEKETAEPLIRMLEAEQVSTSPVAEEKAPAQEAREGEDDGIPDWLRTAAPAEASAEIAPAIEPTPGEMPDWVVALKPSQVPSPQPHTGLESEPVETGGPLEGLRGVLPLALAIAEPHAPSETKPALQNEGAKVFEAILAAPVETAAPPTRARRTFTMRPFIALLLLLAVLVPFLLPFDLTSSTFGIAGTPAAEMFDTLLNLPANSTVLLSFDYDPSMSGEMDLLARALVRDLVKRRVKIIAVSTLETGPQLAQRVLDAAARDAGNYNYGADYLIVYLPGHEAGLAQLSAAGLPAANDFVQKQPLAQFPVAAKIRTLRDVALLVEFAGSDAALQMWIEQVQARVPGIRLAAAVSAAVEPKARAYRSANQLVALMGGLMGAAQYEVLSSQPGLAVISVNAQTAAQLVLVFVILLGNLVFWISRARGNVK